MGGGERSAAREREFFSVTYLARVYRPLVASTRKSKVRMSLSMRSGKIREFNSNVNQNNYHNV